MSGSGTATGRGRSIVRVVHALPWVGLVLVGLALAGGVPPARVRVLAGELVLGALGSGYVWMVGRATARRARRQRAAGLPWQVRLNEPAWLRLHEPALVLTIAATLAALPAALGLPNFSIGVFLPVAVIGVGFPFVSDMLTPAGLTFQAAGLRLHFRRFTVVVPWDEIGHIDTVGPDNFAALMVHLGDVSRIVASADPPTAAVLRDAQLVITPRGPGGTLMLMPWTAGVDGIALLTAIEAGRAGHISPPALN